VVDFFAAGDLQKMAAGTDVMILKIFSPKFLRRN
jgi:hypothetical protein